MRTHVWCHSDDGIVAELCEWCSRRVSASTAIDESSAQGVVGRNDNIINIGNIKNSIIWQNTLLCLNTGNLSELSIKLYILRY